MNYGASGTSGWSSFWFCPNCGNNEGYWDGNLYTGQDKNSIVGCSKCRWIGKYVDLLHSPEEYKNHNRTKLIDKMTR